MKDSE